MNKEQIFMTIAAVGVAIACFVIWNTASKTEFTITSEQHINKSQRKAVTACKSASMQIDGETFNLAAGNADIASSSDHLSFIHRAARGDVDGDNFPDLTCLYSLDTGGSGTFVYVGYLKGLSNDVYQSTATQFLGDRVEVKNLSIEGGRIKTTYMERKLETPFSSPPDLLHTKHFTIEGDQLTTIFDSEASSTMTTSPQSINKTSHKL